MACFLVSAAEAVGVTVAKKVEDKREKKAAESGEVVTREGHIPFSRKLGWLMKMLWGGAFLLMIEHIWHGEVVPWPPFLTAMKNSEDTKEMLKEMGTIGVAMALLVTSVWIVMLIVDHFMEKKGTGFIFKKPGKLHLSVLFMAIFGADLMWLVDCIASVREGEKFYEFTADNMLLGGVVIVGAVVYWGAYLLIRKLAKKED